MATSSIPAPNTLSRYDLLSMRFFYMGKFLSYSQPSQKVGWKSQQTQEARFSALLAIGDLKDKSILDLGCGLGCLYGYLKELGWQGRYTGYDVLDLMIKGARARYPEAQFENRNILLDPPRAEWDYILVSGMFNHKVKDNWDWIAQTVKLCLPLAKQGLAFNLLRADEDMTDSGFFYAKREHLEEKTSLWSKGRYKIVTNYLPDDMTAYLYK